MRRMYYNVAEKKIFWIKNNFWNRLVYKLFKCMLSLNIRLGFSRNRDPSWGYQFPGSMPKIEKKSWISRGLREKSGKFLDIPGEGHDKNNGNLGVNLKKLKKCMMGMTWGVHIHFWKKELIDKISRFLSQRMAWALHITMAIIPFFLHHDS